MFKLPIQLFAKIFNCRRDQQIKLFFLWQACIILLMREKYKKKIIKFNAYLYYDFVWQIVLNALVLEFTITGTL